MLRRYESFGLFQSLKDVSFFGKLNNAEWGNCILGSELLFWQSSQSDQSENTQSQNIWVNNFPNSDWELFFYIVLFFVLFEELFFLFYCKGSTLTVHLGLLVVSIIGGQVWLGDNIFLQERSFPRSQVIDFVIVGDVLVPSVLIVLDGKFNSSFNLDVWFWFGLVFFYFLFWFCFWLFGLPTAFSFTLLLFLSFLHDTIFSIILFFWGLRLLNLNFFLFVFKLLEEFTNGFVVLSHGVVFFFHVSTRDDDFVQFSNVLL